MNLETAIRAVIGRSASDDRVAAVARVLIERDEREPMPAAIKAAAKSAGPRPELNEDWDGSPLYSPTELAGMKKLPGDVT